MVRTTGGVRSGMIRDQRLQAVDFLLDAVGAVAVGFVDDEDVGDFHHAGFEALHVVAHAGNEHDNGDVGEAGDLDFVLADADGFDEQHVFAAGFENERDVGGGEGESAERAAGGHGARVEAGVGMAILKTDAVAENGAAGEGAGGIDGDDADGFAGFPKSAGQAIDQRALAGSGSAGDADAEGAAGMRETGGEQGGRFRGIVFDQRDGAGESAGVAGAEPVDQVADRTCVSCCCG